MTEAYYLQMLDGSDLAWPSSKVVCVGQNYADHIKEMQATQVSDPVIFIKPATALCPLQAPIAVPHFTQDLHHEIELAVIIGAVCRQVDEAAAAAAIHGYALAIDLTARDLQNKFKQHGHPWELAKGFDGSCPISACIPASALATPQNVDLILSVNGEPRQSGNTAQMIHQILPLIAFISQYVTLLPGDVILTGTPAGVGPLHSGDHVSYQLDDLISVQTQIL